MDELSNIVWTALATASSGGLLALLGIWIGSRSEYKKWLREQKHSTYVAYLVALQSVTASAYLPTEWTGSKKTDYELDELRMEAYTKLLIVASPEVANAAIDLLNEVKTSRTALKKLLSDASESILDPDFHATLEQAIRNLIVDAELDEEKATATVSDVTIKATVHEVNTLVLRGFSVVMAKQGILTQAMRRDLKLKELTSIGTTDHLYAELAGMPGARRLAAEQEALRTSEAQSNE